MTKQTYYIIFKKGQDKQKQKDIIVRHDKQKRDVIGFHDNMTNKNLIMFFLYLIKEKLK